MLKTKPQTTHGVQFLRTIQQLHKVEVKAEQGEQEAIKRAKNQIARGTEQASQSFDRVIRTHDDCFTATKI